MDSSQRSNKSSTKPEKQREPNKGDSGRRGRREDPVARTLPWNDESDAKLAGRRRAIESSSAALRDLRPSTEDPYEGMNTWNVSV